MFGASSRHDRVFYEGFERHADRLAAAAKLLDASLASNDTDRQLEEKLHREMCEIKDRADRIAHDMICVLRKTWITPRRLARTGSRCPQGSGKPGTWTGSERIAGCAGWPARTLTMAKLAT